MILIAPTAYKETLGSPEVARAMAEGVRAAGLGPVVSLPLSDGGPGLIDALAVARGGAVDRVPTTGPLGEPVTARTLRLGDTAVLESAEACGLHLVPPDRRDPLGADTAGVGELVRWAAARRVGRIVLGLGGSATVDGGAGVARALGWRLLDGAGRPIPRGGAGLEFVARIEAPASLDLPPVVALADVRNPLLGPDGAAAAFGPQKGADASAVERLERGLGRLATCWTEALGRDLSALPGGGAAGGLGAGAVAFLNAVLEPGSRWVLDAVGFDDAVSRARLVVTGEGAYDAQSAWGKIVGEVVARARAREVPVLLVAGHVEAGTPPGVTAVDGGGARLGPAEIARLVEREAPRLVG